MTGKLLLDQEDVARAIFSPLMLDEHGNLSRAAFDLRHNEDYISVCQMSVASWMSDIHSIPETINRKLFGYCALNVLDIRNLSFMIKSHNLIFEVCEKHIPTNKSHAGIYILLDNSTIKGDRKNILKNIPEDVPASTLAMRYQRRLLDIAEKQIVVF